MSCTKLTYICYFIKFLLHIIYYRPWIWQWIRETKKILLNIKPYRQSIRYQFAWENTDKDFLLLIHNDMYFEEDLVGAYLENIGENIAIGHVGQCWNCSASYAGLCSSETYSKYMPSENEWDDISKKYPGPISRQPLYSPITYSRNNIVWPLPECRLNEFAALINLKIARPITVPIGKAKPIGYFNGEIGTAWFRDISQMGFLSTHYDFSKYATHAWASNGSGHSTLSDLSLYELAEELAKEKLLSEFGVIF